MNRRLKGGRREANAEVILEDSEAEMLRIPTVQSECTANVSSGLISLTAHWVLKLQKEIRSQIIELV